jgi:hypothetical protein
VPEHRQELVEQQRMHLSVEDQRMHEAASMVGLEGSAAAVAEVIDITRMHCVAGLAADTHLAAEDARPSI